jgi:hypothetical protein
MTLRMQMLVSTSAETSQMLADSNFKILFKYLEKTALKYLKPSVKSAVKTAQTTRKKMIFQAI